MLQERSQPEAQRCDAYVKYGVVLSLDSSLDSSVLGVTGLGAHLARLANNSNMSITISHNANANNPSIFKLMSNEITSDYVPLCDNDD